MQGNIRAHASAAGEPRHGCALLRRGLAQAELPQRAVDPQPRELFLHAVLREARAEIIEVDAVKILILVEAGEHDASPRRWRGRGGPAGTGRRSLSSCTASAS